MAQVSLSFNSPFKVVEGDKEGTKEGLKSLMIEGVAITDQPIDSKGVIFTSKGLESVVKRAAPRAKILIDHQLSSTNVVGQLEELTYAGNKVLYRASINPNHPSGIAESIKRGDVDGVSIGGFVEEDKIICSICGEPINSPSCNHFIGEFYNGQRAYGLVTDYQLVELSLTAFPADHHASIDHLSFSELVNSSKVDELLSISSSVRNSLPDSSFAIPSERKLPYKDKNGKIMCDWVRNALKLAPKVKGGVPSSALAKLHSAAKKCGIDSQMNNSSEKFINPSVVPSSEDVRMSEEKVSAEKKTDAEELAKIKVLEAMVDKLSKANQEMELQLKRQQEFIQQKREEERKTKIEELVNLTGIDPKELESFSEEVLDAQLMIARKYKPKKEVDLTVGRASVKQPERNDNKEKEYIKALIRKAFRFNEPSPEAVEKVKLLNLTSRERGGLR